MTFFRCALMGSSVIVLFLTTNSSIVTAESPFQHQENVVYAEVHGVGLLADVFVPKDTKNGRAIVEVVSGAWRSDRGKLDDLAKARLFEILCGRGYTVFAIRPGSIPSSPRPKWSSTSSVAFGGQRPNRRRTILNPIKWV